MHVSPTQSNPAPRQDNSNESAVLPDAQQARPGGADQADDRMALDNSRAVAPAYFGLQPDGRLRVSQDIRQLLALRSNIVDLNASDGEAEDEGAVDAAPSQLARKSVFAVPLRLPRADIQPAAANRTIDFNIPPSSHRFLSMSLPALLQEVADRAIGNGPPDPVVYPNSTTAPEDRRRGDMVWALQHQPGRERDAQVLRHAGAVLAGFFAQYKWLVAAVREKRPDLEPMMAEWTADLAREPLRKVLERPFDPNEELTYASSLSGELRENVELPCDVHIAELDARVNERLRFSQVPVLSLLEEVVQRAIGGGPPDARAPADTTASPEMNRIDEMVRVLQTVAGRHNDAITLRNAGRLLRELFTELHVLHRDVRSRRPDLEPVLQQWITDLARPALQRALDTPDLGDRSFVPDGGLSWAIARVARGPMDRFLPALDRLLMQHLEPGFIARFPEFFRRMSRTAKPGETLQNIIHGAAYVESMGRDSRWLLQGKVVFRCTEAQFAEHVQLIPAAIITAAPALSPLRVSGGWRLARWEAAYPRGSGENWLQAVYWEPPGDIAVPVYVALRDGVHSYSYATDEGQSWRPTGGPSYPAMDLIRTERWSEFLAQLQARAYGIPVRRDVGTASGR